MQVIVNGIDLFSVVKSTLIEYSNFGFAIFGFYVGAIFYKYLFVGKKRYENTSTFSRRKKNEIIKLKSEIEFLKKNISDIKKEKRESRKKLESRIELDFEKKLPNKDKVYEIVKNIYKDLQETKTKKTFNLTEAVFMMRNMEEYNFFTKESGRIMFEKKIEIVNYNDSSIDKLERKSISDFNELEIKEMVINFKLPQDKEEEMLVAVLSGSSYVYQIVQGLNCIFTNEFVRFIRDGNNTISADWAEIDMIHPYTELYKLLTTKDENGNDILKAVKKTSEDIQKKEKENDALNQNIDDLKKDEQENDFSDINQEEDFLNLNKNTYEQNNAINCLVENNDKVNNNSNNKNIKMVSCVSEGSILDFFKKKSWLNISDNFEIEIFKKLFEKYSPNIHCVFYKTNAKSIHLYIDIEILVLLISSQITIKNILNKFYRGKANFMNASMQNKETFSGFELAMKENLDNARLGRNTEDEKLTIKYYSKYNDAYYSIVCYKIKITKEILDAIHEVVDIPLYSKDTFISEFRDDLESILCDKIIHEKFEKFPLVKRDE